MINLTINSAVPDPETGEYLDQLCRDLSSYEDLVPAVTRAPPPKGQKDGGITLAIAFAALAVNTVNMIIGILKLKSDSDQRYSITITRGSQTLKIDNPTKESVALLMKQPSDVPVQVTIERKEDAKN